MGKEHLLTEVGKEREREGAVECDVKNGRTMKEMELLKVKNKVEKETKKREQHKGLEEDATAGFASYGWVGGGGLRITIPIHQCVRLSVGLTSDVLISRLALFPCVKLKVNLKTLLHSATSGQKSYRPPLITDAQLQNVIFVVMYFKFESQNLSHGSIK